MAKTKSKTKKKVVAKSKKASSAKKRIEVRGGYVDGFLIAAPKNKVSEYRKMAQLGAKIWKKYGALDYKECLADDLKVQDMGEDMRSRSFLEAAGATANETVWFSYILYKNKKHRDGVNKKVMSDPEMKPENWDKDKGMPFDMKKFHVGGFKVEVQ